MIPKKGTADQNLNTSLNKDVDNSERQAHDAIKNSKPAMYRNIATRSAQYIALALTAGGIVYKMFISDSNVMKKKPKEKKALSSQQIIANQSIDKGGKGIVSNKKDIDILNKDKIADEEYLVGSEIPKLLPAKLPDVPILTMPVEIKKEPEVGKKDDEKENRFIASAPAIPSIPTGQKSKQPDKPQNQIQGQKFSPKDNLVGGDRSKSALDSMFVLSGQGPAPKVNQSRSGGKNDFILFDDTNLSVRDISQTPNNVQTSRLSNLDTTIATGKVIECVLETAINSEIPGMVRAIVSRDVFGEMGNKILIPMGSRLYGTYSATVNRGQSRVAIIWNKVLRPDGLAITINAAAADQFGRAGIEGDVDSRYFEMFQNSMLMSFITLGSAVALEKVLGIGGQTQIVSGATGTITNTNMTPANVAAQSVVTTAADIAKKMTEGLLEQVKPVISIPQGMLLKVIVNQDLTVPSYKRNSANFDK
jgi:type IV secretion system protein VirB10